MEKFTSTNQLYKDKRGYHLDFTSNPTDQNHRNINSNMTLLLKISQKAIYFQVNDYRQTFLSVYFILVFEKFNTFFIFSFWKPTVFVQGFCQMQF